MSLTSGYPEDLLVKIKCFMPEQNRRKPFVLACQPGQNNQ